MTALADPSRRWLVEVSDGELGLWWLADDVRALLGPTAGEDEVMDATLRALKPLLEQGLLRACDSMDYGRNIEWPGPVDEILRKIWTAWLAIGRPKIGDVVCFIDCRATGSAQ